MPELPDVTVYVEAISARVTGTPLLGVRLGSPFLLRTVEPPIAETAGKLVKSVHRLGKRIVIDFEGDLHLAIHLMIAGRLHWRPAGAKLHRKLGLAAFDFPAGTLVLTEAGNKRRAALHVVRGAAGMQTLDRGGIEVLDADLGAFHAALVRENRTLKRALTDPRLVSGIGNAYSDEILHRARLSPVTLTRRLDGEAVARLHAACRATLMEWTETLRAEAASEFPERVTAFRADMAVHGRFGKPCPDCGAPVQRIVHADNESNYCARCQTGGKLLADRALSRLLKADWPPTLEELEESRRGL